MTKVLGISALAILLLAAAMPCLAALSASEASARGGFPSLKGLSQARRLLFQEKLPQAPKVDSLHGSAPF